MNEKLTEALKGMYDSLTDEQKEKARACKTMEELAALAAKEGIELPDEVLDTVAGGIPMLGCDEVNKDSQCPEATAGDVIVYAVTGCSDSGC